MPISGIPFLNVTNTSKEIQIVDATQPRLSLYVGTNVAGGLSATSTGSLVFETSSGIERARILSTGQFGIGTTTPGAKLEVFNSGGTVFNVLGSLGQLFSVTDNLSGEIFAVADISGVPIMSINSSGSIKFGSYSGTNQTGTPTYMLGTTATGGVVKVLGADIPGVPGGSGTTNFLARWTPDSDTLGIGVTFDNGTNVGIGTTAPLGKLQVNEYTVASQGNQGVHGELTVFANNGDESLFLGIKNAAYPDRGWAFNPVTNGVNSNLQIKEHGASSVRMTLQTGGNVGIGTTSPVNKIQANYAPVAIASLTANSGTASTNWNRNAFLMGTGASISNALAFGVSGTANDRKAWIQSGHPDSAANSLGIISLNPLGGNVGIGVTNPGRKLSIDGSIELTGSDMVLNTTSAAIRRGSSGQMFLDAPGDVTVTIDSNNNNTDRVFNVKKDTSTELFRVQEDGNVGIGDTLPVVKLQVSTNSPTNNVATLIGDGWVGSDAYHKEGGLLLISGTSQDSTQTGAGIAFQTRTTANSNYWKSSIIMDRDGAIRFTLGGAGTSVGSEDFTILSNGKIGIGITAPTANLQIAGNTIYNNDGAQALRVCDAADISKGIHIGYDTTLDNGIIQAGDFGIVYKDLLLNPNAGNVGIGLTSATAKLHVAGTGLFTGLVSGITPVAAANFVTKAYVDGSGGGTGPFLPLAGGTMTGTNGVIFPDNFALKIGTGSDLQISHDAADSSINNNLGHLYITQNADDKDVYFRNDDGSGGVAIYFFLDGSAADGTGNLYTNFPDNSRLTFGGATDGDLQIFHDGSNSYIIDNGTGTFNLRGSTQVIIGGKNGEVGIQYVENAGVGLRHNNVTKLVTESTGVAITGAITATTFSGDLNGTINTATTAVTQVNAVDNETVATTAYVNNKIQLIPAGLVFQGTWDARTAAEGGAAGDRGNPALANGVGTTGNFYIVSNSGSVNLDGITDWKVGDWAVFIEQGASDQWEKIDNSSVLDGVGTGQTLPLWSGSGTSNTLTDSRFSQTSTQNIITGPGTAGSDLSINVKNSAGQVAIQALGTGEVVIPSNYLFVSSSQGAYIAGILRARGGVTDDLGTLNLGGNGLTTNLTLTSNTKATFAGDVFIKSAALSNQENTDVDTGTETVGEVSTADFTAAFFDFVVKKTTNVRSGTVYACHDGTNVQFTETSTQDLGNTSDVVLSVDISGGSMRLRATVASDDWSIKSLIRGI